MTDITQGSIAAEPPIWTRRTFIAAGLLAALIALADVLFYERVPGISLAIFAFATMLAIVALHPEKLGQGRTVAQFLAALVSSLPLVETASPTGLLSSMGGIGLLALGISDKLPKFEDWLGTFTRFGVLAPVRLLGDGLRLLGEAGEQKLGSRVVHTELAWLVPVGFAVIFVWLFTAANPVVESWIRAIRLDELIRFLQPARVVLWGFVAVTAWPVLMPKLLQWTALPQVQGPVMPRTESLVFGEAAIRNSLIVFNALFAMQTAMDLMFLWGGVRLPEGMTHAEYAHRGAYPLVVTAILAGAFVLAAMRRDGPGERSPLIRTLVYLWIGQNVWLVISSLLRLKLYVEEFQLTELRIASAIWMGLVAVGLVLIVVKLVLGKSNKWLLATNLAALSLTFWGVSWLDFGAAISRYNVEHSYEVTGEGVTL
ncbi:MAG TPA: DUF4173 domain-containing protein, partial [Polyangiaceae bacterium]|nr:DUF4173 domain-containing protein [Polyangiaceae bacterium]